MKQFSRYPKSAQVAIIVGLAFVLIGAWRLIGFSVGFGWWNTVSRTVGSIFSFLWPLALIAAGLYLVWAGRTGRLKGMSSIDWKKPFGRSHTDRRVAGICGGIAQFLSIDPTIVRVLVVILFVITPVFTLLAYVLAALFLPQA